MFRTLILVALILCVSSPVLGDQDGSSDRARKIVELQDAFQHVARHVTPAVVAVRAMREADTGGQVVYTGPSYGLGTGVVVRSDGLVLTNYHVVDRARKIQVVLPGGAKHEARLWGQDPRHDLVMLRIDAENLPVAPLGDASTVAPGQWVVALGNPFGLALDGQPMLSVGVVSAVGRSLPTLGRRENRSYVNMIQATADLNPGHSGGPMVDLSGKVVGINTAIFSRTGRSEGVGFAVPISVQTRGRLDRMACGETIEYGYIGVDTTAVASGDSGETADKGVRIWRIEPDGPAQAAGLLVGDVLLAFDGRTVSSEQQLRELVWDTAPGTLTTLSVLRKGQSYQLQVEVADGPDESALVDMSDPAVASR